MEQEYKFKSRLQSVYTMMYMCDTMLLVLYLILLVFADVGHVNESHSRPLIEIWAICILQALIIIYSCKSKKIKNQEQLDKWVLHRRIHHFILILLFCIAFVAGYHDLLGTKV
jgi:hypothetical protein